MGKGGRSGWVALGGVAWLMAAVLLQPVVRAETEGSNNRKDYVEVPLSNLKGTLASGDPTQLPLLAIHSSTGSQARLPEVALDRSNPNHIVAWVTYLGLEDDSVRNMRYRVEIVPSDARCSCQRWQVSWVGRQYQCQAGRGAQDWTSQTCQ